MEAVIAVQLRREVCLLGEQHGSIDFASPIDVCSTELDGFSISYRTPWAVDRRIDIPRAKLHDRWDIYKEHFPQRWGDPVV